MTFHVNISNIIDNLYNAVEKKDVIKILQKYIKELSEEKTTISPSKEIYDIYPEYFRAEFLDATIRDLTEAMVEYKNKWDYTNDTWRKIAQGNLKNLEKRKELNN